jgi:protein-S-isoprenylcysteine O-methyltransferase Ste14
MSQDKTDAAHKNWWQIGEVVFGTPLLAAVVLQPTVPLTFAPSIFTPTLSVIGVIVCVVGISLIVAARRAFSEHQQPTDPGLPTSFVMITGVFSISRNPMYLGAVCFLIGLTLIFKLTWMLIFLVPTLIACHSILIEPEEQYLAIKFGAEYQRYAASVHRWIGRRSQSEKPDVHD